MVIRKNTFFLTFIFGIIILVCNVIAFSLNGDVSNSIRFLGYICLIELICFIVLNSQSNGKVLNFASVFAVVLFIFNFGQLMINSFFKSIYSHVRFLLLLDHGSALFGFQYINLAFSLLCFGMMVAELKSREFDISEKDTIINNSYDFLRVAKDIVWCTFPVKAVIDILCFGVSILKGGTAARAWMNAFPNVLVYYGKISLIGFALLIVLYRSSPKQQNKVFAFIEVYILLMMVSGIRSENVGYFLVFAFIFFATRRKKIRIPSLLLYCALGFIALTFIVVVGAFRNTNGKSLGSFFDLFLMYFTEKNIILSLFDTCGDTGYTAQCVINKWLPQYGPSYGDSYYLGIFSVLPNIPVIFTFPGSITSQSCFALKLQAAGTLSSSYTNIGGSLIGELFFNFGLFGGCVIALLVGLVLGTTSRKCTDYIANDNYYGLIRVIPIMFATIYWVRDYFGGEFREVVWGPLICLIIIGMFQRRTSNVNNK